MFFAPFIMLITSIAIAFWVALKDGHMKKDEME
ncbi:hypothetical protein [Paenibacillus sp. VTT E-133291]